MKKVLIFIKLLLKIKSNKEMAVRELIIFHLVDYQIVVVIRTDLALSVDLRRLIDENPELN
ncbi:hypothetical protein KGF86_01745 [Ornithinibacillus massiliensis]|uniref:Uncharacterized protein n=1 Tax=Ornithinibacillus massiliensis TaxID=1944633 RepID=A0ABS5M9D8_9BACI|nr:hypothetical protein [Ornithinibacillus massiliensis]MBS3678927.1 hypothetical protein [Ornithinibacillus massiliensis]